MMLLRVVLLLRVVPRLPAVSRLGVSRLPGYKAGLRRRHLRALVYRRPAPDAKVGRGEWVRDAAIRAVSRRLPGLLQSGAGGGGWMVCRGM